MKVYYFINGANGLNYSSSPMDGYQCFHPIKWADRQKEVEAEEKAFLENVESQISEIQKNISDIEKHIASIPELLDKELKELNESYEKLLSERELTEEQLGQLEEKKNSMEIEIKNRYAGMESGYNDSIEKMGHDIEDLGNRISGAFNEIPEDAIYTDPVLYQAALDFPSTHRIEKNKIVAIPEKELNENKEKEEKETKLREIEGQLRSKDQPSSRPMLTWMYQKVKDIPEAERTEDEQRIVLIEEEKEILRGEYRKLKSEL